MDETNIIEKLMLFGLTRHEAQVYLVLLKDKELTGYEVAKEIGVSRSNVYNALSGLADKGAAYLMEGNVTKYTALPVEEFCGNVIKNLTSEKEYLQKNMPSKKDKTEGYITIQGVQNIRNRIASMLKQCEKRLYLLTSVTILEQLEPELTEAIDRGIKVVIITDETYNREKAIVYHTNVEEGQIRFITDSAYVLTGMMTGHKTDTCLYSGQENLVTLFKESLKNKITLINMKGMEK